MRAVRPSPEGSERPEGSAVRPIVKLTNSWQIGFVRDIPRKGKRENSRVFIGEWWAWVDLNHRPRPYQGLLSCYMHSACDNEHAFLLDQHRILARDFHFVACIALSAIGLGACQPPSSAIMRSASVGPQVFGS